MTWDWGPCSKRADESELDADLKDVLDFIDFTERWWGGHRVVLNYLNHFSRQWSGDGPLTLLDICCGRGGLARSIIDWARPRKWDLRIHAVDTHPQLIQWARAGGAGYPEITFEVRDLKDPLFLQAQQFDYVVSSYTLHRHNREKAVDTLKVLNRLAKRGVIVCDLLRDIRCFFWETSWARLFGNPAVRRAAALAVRQGFTTAEVKRLAKEAGLNEAVLREHLGFRFSLAGERGLALSRQFDQVTGLAGT